MSEWSDKEIPRLKQLMADKRIQNEKSVQEYNTKQAKGLGFWESTRSAAKRLVDEINEKVSNGLLLWDGGKPEAFKIMASGFEPRHHTTATYSEKAFTVKYFHPAMNAYPELQLVVDGDQVFWRDNASHKNLTAEQAAEHIVGALTSSLKI